MDNRPIGVFDSGVGGLSILRQLHRRFPQEDLVYFGDTGRVPYGTRSSQIIRQYAAQDMAFLLSKGVKMLVAACGTVSSNMTAEAIAALPVPYTGVIEPSAQAACQATRNGIIGVVGTSATISSGAFPQVIEALRPGTQVVCNPCPLLIPLVEDGHIGREDPLTGPVVAEYLAPIQASGADTLILGCTHFPLIYEIFDRLLEGKVHLIDPGISTAERVDELLQRHNLKADADRTGSLQFYVSDQPEGFLSTAEPFLGFPIGSRIQTVSIEEITTPKEGR